MIHGIVTSYPYHSTKLKVHLTETYMEGRQSFRRNQRRKEREGIRNVTFRYSVFQGMLASSPRGAYSLVSVGADVYPGHAWRFKKKKRQVYRGVLRLKSPPIFFFGSPGHALVML